MTPSFQHIAIVNQAYNMNLTTRPQTITTIKRSNKNKPWTDNDKFSLVRSANTGMSINELANKFDRTERSIYLALVKAAYGILSEDTNGSLIQ